MNKSSPIQDTPMDMLKISLHDASWVWCYRRGLDSLSDQRRLHPPFTTRPTHQADSAMSEYLEFPPLTGQDVLNCSFSSWYTKYHRLSPRARIIKPLPESF